MSDPVHPKRGSEGAGVGVGANKLTSQVAPGREVLAFRGVSAQTEESRMGLCSTVLVKMVWINGGLSDEWT